MCCFLGLMFFDWGLGYVGHGFIRPIASQIRVDWVVACNPRNRTHVTPNIHVDTAVVGITLYANPKTYREPSVIPNVHRRIAINCKFLRY